MKCLVTHVLQCLTPHSPAIPLGSQQAIMCTGRAGGSMMPTGECTDPEQASVLVVKEGYDDQCSLLCSSIRSHESLSYCKEQLKENNLFDFGLMTYI